MQTSYSSLDRFKKCLLCPLNTTFQQKVQSHGTCKQTMGCDAVGRAVNFDSKDPQFESRPSLIREWPLISATRFGFFERSQWKIFSQPKPKFWADLKMSLLRWKLMCPLLGHFCKHLATFYFKIWSHWPMYTECTIMKRLNWKSLHLYQEPLLMTGQRDSTSNREI